MFNKSDQKKVPYDKPELIRIELLDETALGDTFSPEEPPFPAPPRGGGGTASPDSTAGGFGNEQRPV